MGCCSSIQVAKVLAMERERQNPNESLTAEIRGKFIIEFDQNNWKKY